MNGNGKKKRKLRIVHVRDMLRTLLRKTNKRLPAIHIVALIVLKATSVLLEYQDRMRMEDERYPEY